MRLEGRQGGENGPFTVVYICSPSHDPCVDDATQPYKLMHAAHSMVHMEAGQRDTDNINNYVFAPSLCAGPLPCP